MYAQEFQTTITDPYITIPDFERFKNKQVRIIILDTNTKAAIANNRDDFIANASNHPKKVSHDLHFLSRDDAHAR